MPQGSSVCAPQPWSCALEPRILSCGSPRAPEPVLSNKRLRSETPAPQEEKTPVAAARESPARPRLGTASPPPPKKGIRVAPGIPGKARDPSLEMTWTGVTPKITALDIPRRCHCPGAGSEQHQVPLTWTIQILDTPVGPPPRPL